MKRKIAVYLVNKDVRGWNASEEDIAFLRRELPDYSVNRAENTEEFMALLADADIALTWHYHDEWVQMFPGVKVIGTPAAGADYLPAEIPGDMNVVRGTFHGITMSETAIGMMLEHSRRIIEANRLMKHGQIWPRSELDRRLRSFTGSHVAILGFGAIGMFTAGRLKAFDCRITGVRRSAVSAPDFFTGEDAVVNIESLPSLLHSVDHLVSFLPGTADTTNLINMDMLRMLPAHAAVYSLGRGNVIVEEDLICALEQNIIAGAYLDVFQEEPLSAGSPLRQVDNLYIMPHASAISPDYMRLFFRELPAKIRNIMY